MKKIFSLLCATLLVFSASAAQMAPKAELAKKAPVAVKQMQKVQFEKAQFAKTVSLENVQLSNQLSATPALTVSNQKAQVPAILGKKVVKEAKQKTALQTSAPAKAPQAIQADPIVVIIKGNPSIAPAGGVQAITVEGNDNMVYAWGVKAETLEAGKTYTFADMDINYTYRCSQDYFTTWEDPTDATFSIDADKNITASMVTESGTYMVYTTAPQPGYETVDVVAISCEIDDYDTDMMYTLVDANNDIYQFDIYYTGSIELGHTYTYDDMDKTYSCYATGGKGYPFETAEFTITENEKGLKHIAATITVPAFNKQFNITWDQPEPQSHEVVASDFGMNDYGTDMYMGLTDADGNIFYFDVYYTGSFELGKTYTLTDMDPSYSYYKLAAGSGLSYAEASITVSEDQAELLHVVANVVLSNGDSYKITYDEKPFEPSGKQINVNGTNLKGEYISYYGMYVYSADCGNDINIELAFNVTTEKATYTNDDLIPGYCAYYSSDYETYVEFKKLATDITITNTDTSKTLTGSIYATDGDEYVLNLVYEKPDAKEIFVNVANADLNTKTLTAGFWTIGGTTADKNNSVNIYFISKALQGTFTDVEQFDAYSTWVSDKSSGSNVYYENLSAVNLTSAVVADSLVIEGTMNLADYNGNEAIVTVHITTPFTQTWGEWEDYAPLDFNTGKYILDLFGKNLRNIPVQVRKANTGLKQYKLAGWGAGYFCEKGADLIIEVDGKNVCTIAPTYTGFAEDPYFAITDYDTWNGTYGASTFDPETCTFNFMAVWYNASNGERLSMSYDSFVMDRPINERDTVKVNLDRIVIEKDIDEETGDLLGWLYIGEDTDTTYLVQVVGAEKYGTFSYADSTLGDYYLNIIPSSEEGYAIPFYEGEVTIVEDEEGIKLTGLMTGDDEKAYVLNWILPAGILQYDTDAPFVYDFAWRDMSASIDNGVISISLQKGTELAMELELYTDPALTTIPEGTYTISDTQEAGTALQSVGYDDIDGATPCYAATLVEDEGILYLNDMWFLVEGTITLSYDEYGKLKVVVDAVNSLGQPVKAVIAYEKIEPKNTVTVADAELYIYEGFMEEYGLVNFYGGNEEFEFDLYAYSDTLFGNFTNDIDFMVCGLYIDTVELGVLDANLLEVTLDGKDITFKAEVLGSDTVLYVITATGYYGALDYDTNDDYEGVYEFEDVVFDQEAVDDANYIIIQGENEAGDYFALAIEGKLTDEGAIAAGEYTEVWASFGLDEEYYPSISFVWDAEDYLWFIQSGKLTVYENGAMFFEGLNSYDKNVTITVNEEPSALINTKATMKAVKALKNGMIVIKKNGKAYNVLGIAL